MSRMGMLWAGLLGAALILGCGASTAGVVDEPKLPGDEAEQAFSSPLATLLDFKFTATFTSDTALSTSWARSQIDEQLLFTIGSLNGERSVGRLDKVTITNIRSTRQSDGRYLVSYDARLPVAWGSKTNLPTSYQFTLPSRIDAEGVEAFTAKYKAKCVDFGAHDVDSGSIWYYYRPKASGCVLDSADVMKTTATISTSTLNTSGKYPEYQKVWSDRVLKVVAIFGKYEDGATTSSDAGIAAFNAFVKAVRTLFTGATVTTAPATIPTSPGVATPDVAFFATLPSGLKVQVNVLLVDNVRTSSAAFQSRYAELSTDADLIAYNGHAGLGANVRALARMGRFVAGKYLMVFMNGCDTFAYVDGSLAQTRAALNPDDPTGTKYMEFLTNAMPAYFSSDSPATLAVIKGLLSVDKPMSYDQILASVDRAQVVTVTGEEDNVFAPGMVIVPGGSGGGGGTDTTIVNGTGTVARGEEQRYSATSLAAGKYQFDLSGSGDADLYVRVGGEVSATQWTCRPYLGGSRESCTVSLTSPGSIFVMVKGYATTSTFALVGKRVP